MNLQLISTPWFENSDLAKVKKNARILQGIVREKMHLHTEPALIVGWSTDRDDLQPWWSMLTHTQNSVIRNTYDFFASWCEMKKWQWYLRDLCSDYFTQNRYNRRTIALIWPDVMTTFSEKGVHLTNNWLPDNQQLPEITTPILVSSEMIWKKVFLTLFETYATRIDIPYKGVTKALHEMEKYVS